jgi:hypothetical protein
VPRPGSMRRMAGHEVVAPTDERRRLHRSMVERRSLDEVVEAVTDAVRWQSSIYVERRGCLYRWSLAHGGGPYPLLRLVCKFLEIPHYWVLVSCAPFDGWTITACREGEPAEAAAIVDFPLGAGPAEVRQTVLETVGGPGSQLR